MRLGASWDPDRGGSDTRFVARSSVAERLELCLFDADGERRLPMLAGPEHLWGVQVPVGPGQHYGFRVHGPWAPEAGHRCDPAKLLLDPYARRITGAFSLGEGVLERGVDSAPYVPRSVVVDPRYDWSDDSAPRRSRAERVFYELHVKGFTARHPDVPEKLRGTYAGLAHPAAVSHLVDLGVTTVDLLPIHQHVSEPHLLRRGLTNYWGYNSIGFFAPHEAYSATGDPVTEFRDMVRALHEAGLEVVLDVVYNHTAEGDEDGPTLCWRGFDNATSYRLDPADRARYDDVTGCGSTLDLRSPHILRTVLDSLRYWAQEMHVDGFRFDLAPALTRDSAFLHAVEQDPILRECVLIAEPWDLGPDGYHLGRFPAPWAEWNGAFRDVVRDAWRGQGDLAALAQRMAGSADVFVGDGARRPWASITFVTAHDGFTLHDLTAYDRKHNEANGEGNRDGEEHNRSWNCGVEGPTEDEQVDALRMRQAANLLSTLLLSVGVPMLSMGDEVRRTQQGNNNAYCQDGPLSFMPWEPDPATRALHRLTRYLLRLRRENPCLRPETFPTGEPDEHGVADLTWLRPDGGTMSDQDWHGPEQRTLLALFDGVLLVVVHLPAEETTISLPHGSWEVLLDTAGRPVGTPGAGPLRVLGRSVVALRRTQGEGLVTS